MLGLSLLVIYMNKIKEIYNSIWCHLMNKGRWFQRRHEKKNFEYYSTRENPWRSCYSCELAKSRLDGKYNCKIHGVTCANSYCGGYKLRSKYYADYGKENN